MSALEIRRGSDCSGSRLGQGQSHRHLSSEVRNFGGEWGPGRVPPNGGIGEIGMTCCRDVGKRRYRMIEDGTDGMGFSSKEGGVIRGMAILGLRCNNKMVDFLLA